MNLTDIVSASRLSDYAEIGLLIFFVVFVAIVVRTLMRPRREIEEQARIVLGDETEER